VIAVSVELMATVSRFDGMVIWYKNPLLKLNNIGDFFVHFLKVKSIDQV